MNKLLPIITIAIVGLTSGCGDDKKSANVSLDKPAATISDLPGASIVGKWACSPDANNGWSIEYKDNGDYEVTFNNGKAPWIGKYARKEFVIAYTPNVAAENSTTYLKQEIQAVNRTQRSMVISDKPGTSAPTMCYLVS